MTRASTFLVVVAQLIACSESGAPTAPNDPSAAERVPLAAATSHNRVRDLVTDDILVINGCNREAVQLHLRQLFTLHEVSVDGKFFHGHLTFNDRGTRDVGLSTGLVYHQTGAEQEFFHLNGEVNQTRRVEVTLNLIGQGQEPNYVVHEILRLLVSPTGELRVDFDRIREACRG